VLPALYWLPCPRSSVRAILFGSRTTRPKTTRPIDNTPHRQLAP
jgi:hypothetical protein